MRALICTNGQVVFDTRAPEPELGAGMALVRTLRAGISPVDIAISRGTIPHHGVMGHEFVGVVERVAGDAGASLVGKRVVGQPEIVCAACDLCRSGLSRHCRDRRTLGVGSTAGCIAERFAVPVRNLVPIPETMDLDAAALAEPLSCALHAAQIVRIVGKTYITVLGDDAHALLVAQVMAKQNASVRILGQQPERFSIAEKWGVKHRHASEAGRRADQDVVLCASPDARSLIDAMGMVRPRGKIVLRGSHAHERSDWSGAEISLIADLELDVVGARGGRVADAVAALEQKQFDVGSLVGRRFRFDDAVAALRAASEPGALKILIEFPA